MYYKTLFFSVLLSLLFCTPALNQRFYLGGSVGNGFNNRELGDISGEDFKIKESTLAQHLFLSETSSNFKFDFYHCLFKATYFKLFDAASSHPKKSLD